MKRKKRSNPKNTGKTRRQLEQEMYNCLIPMEGSDDKPYPIEQFRKDLNKSLEISNGFSTDVPELEELTDEMVKSIENYPPDQLNDIERVEENMSKYMVDDYGNPMTKEDIRRFVCKTIVLTSLY